MIGGSQVTLSLDDLAAAVAAPKRPPSDVADDRGDVHCRRIAKLHPRRDGRLYGTNSFQQSCRMVAEALGFDVEAVTTQPSFARARRDLLDGRVKAGTVGGIRLEVSATSNGAPVVSEDLQWRLDDDLDPAWPADPDAGEWLVTIDGDPCVRIGASVSGSNDHVGPGQRATAARMINSIPDVCSAAPGILTAASAPLPRCWNMGLRKS